MDDERLEQFERHRLRQPALVQLELRADDDDRTARVVDALAEQVLTEPALLALEHVGQRLERTLAATADRLRAAAVVEQRVDRLLQHALLVAEDDFRRAVRDELLTSRLLRLMTRRYRSLRSDVAKRPPSSGTSGRRSGGITGTTSRIIHSGLLRTSPESPELRNASTILSRLSICFLRCCEFSSTSCVAQLLGRLSTSRRRSSSRTAGAPMSARNAVSLSSLAFCGA